jgi:hypothetical protein
MKAVDNIYIYTYIIEMNCKNFEFVDIIWCSWLGRCNTSRKVAVPSPDLHNPSGRTMALGSIWSDRNEYHECLLGGKGGRCVGMKNLLFSYANCLEILGSSTS